MRLFLMLFSVSTIIASANVGEWKTYTAKREIRDLTVVGDILWAVTNGGLFSYRMSDGSFAEYTTSDGLRTIDLTAITSDGQGTLWIGASNGFLHRFRPALNDWLYITDIFLKPNPQKRINGLQIHGDTLFVLSDIGLSIFSTSRLEFGDTYTRFGTQPNQIAGNITSVQLFNAKVWVGTRQGIATTPLSNSNPSVPESWQVYKVSNGLPSDNISALVKAFDTLYAATSQGLAVYNDSLWTTITGTSGLNTVDAIPNPQFCFDCPVLYFITQAEIWAYGGNNPLALIATGFTSNLTTILTDTILGSEKDALFLSKSGSWVSAVPPGPPSNKFVGITVDEQGVVWSGTGSGNGDGFMSFDGTMWKSYTIAQDPRLGNNNYYKVSIGKDNAKWVSNWGNGVALLDDQGSLRNVFNAANGLLPTVQNDTSFVVVGGVAVDQNGVTWITNRTPPDSIAVVLYHLDSSLSYNVRFFQNIRDPLTVFTDIVIDYNGTKWFANYNRFEPEQARALYYFNENVSLPGTINGWGALTVNEGLTSNQVWSLAVDREGDLWIGSDRGITIIFNPANPRISMAAYHPLRDQVIQAIVADPLNNKWIATKQGVFVLSFDGTSILERYTVENTNGKLLDDDVASLAIDERSGIVYFGTEKGLSSLTTDATEPVRSFEQLAFTPNPYYLPSPIQLTVDGLMQGSTLKIFTVDGNLVREIHTSGGRIGFWDGRDTQGSFVATAVYLIVAYSENGNQVATGKVAVIRR
ncbi:MAG: hypothetical protein HY707_05645 [Ignavibacteriae bacterium]|nr:hypothetical protein [Ignavibacteriota bacterium]